MLDSTAAAASDGDFALEERHSLLEDEVNVERGLNCSAAAACEFVFGLDDLEFVPGSDRDVGHNTASSLTEGFGDQASGRVQQLCTSNLGTLGDKKRISCTRMKTATKYFKYMGMRKSHE